MIDFDITDFTENGKCSNCGNCCSNFLPITEYEITQIKRYIKAHNIKEQRHNVYNGYDCTCPFRDEVNRKCLIYAVRPLICRAFLCNHTKEDIMKSKLAYHKIGRVVLMRHEFFGSKEDVEFMKKVLKGEINNVE